MAKKEKKYPIYSYTLNNGQIRYRYHLSYKGSSLYRQGFKTQKEAERSYRHELFQIEPKRVDKIPFSLLCDSFLMYQKDQIKASSFESLKRRIEKYILLIPDIDIMKIDFKVLHAWFSSLPCSLGQKKRFLHDLKGLFEFAELYFGKRNIEYKKLVVPKDYSIKKIVKEIYVLSIEDFKRFYAGLDSEYWKLLFLITFICGLRSGELRGLTPEAFDFEDGSVQIFQQVVDLGKGKPLLFSPKTENSVRICYLPKMVSDRVALFIQSEGLQEQDFLFHSPRSKKDPVGETSMNRKLHDVQKEVGLPFFRFHSFRKSEVSLLNDIGLSGDLIKEYIGHDSFLTSKKYYIGDSAEKKKKIRDILSVKLEGFER